MVSKEGTLWRWDGLVRKGRTSSEAERIRQRQRLVHLSTEEDGAKTSFADKQSALDEAYEAHQECLERYRSLQQYSRQAGSAAETARRHYDSVAMALTTARSRANDLKAAQKTAQKDLDALNNNE